MLSFINKLLSLSGYHLTIKIIKIEVLTITIDKNEIKQASDKIDLTDIKNRLQILKNE